MTKGALIGFVIGLLAAVYLSPWGARARVAICLRMVLGALHSQIADHLTLFVPQYSTGERSDDDSAVRLVQQKGGRTQVSFGVPHPDDARTVLAAVRTSDYREFGQLAHLWDSFDAGTRKAVTDELATLLLGDLSFPRFFA